MTQKDYMIIAQALYDVRPVPEHENGELNTQFDTEIEQWTACVSNLIVYLRANDRHFNSTDFLLACERGRVSNKKSA